MVLTQNYEQKYESIAKHVATKEISLFEINR